MPDMTDKLLSSVSGRQRCCRPPNGSPVSQRGAFGIMGALTLLLGVLFTALAVDSGRLMLEHRRLQSVADMAALDAAAQSGSCGDGTLATADAAAQASAGRNNFAVGGTQTLNVALGNVTTGGVRVFTAGDPSSAQAVEVTAGNTVPASLVAGGLLGEQVALQAVAVAERQAQAGFSAGSLLVSLNTDDSELLNSLLGGILGSQVNLVAYSGIAATNVTLLNLVHAAAGVGTVQELLVAELNVGELLQIYADAVTDSGVVNADVDLALQQLISASVTNLTLILGDVLAVSAPNVESAASASVNLLDLITTTVLVANGQNALTVPLGINLPGGLLNVNTILKVIEPPQIAIGPPGKNVQGDWLTQAHTAQVHLETKVQSHINLLGLLGADVDLALLLEVAQGTAWLQSVQCRNQQNPDSIVTIGAQPGIASVKLTMASDTAAPAANIHLTLASLPLADVTAGLGLSLQNPSEDELVYTVEGNPVDALPMVQRTSSSVGGSLGNGLTNLADSVQIDVNLLGAGLSFGDILDAVVGGLLEPLLTQLVTAIVDPLLRLLGIQIGSVDVQLFSLTIGRPALLI
ncbi:MAG: TadG family pilus assembly protein [Gammaproteobacteria bacterium]